jgi:hypothetical protein
VRESPLCSPFGSPPLRLLMRGSIEGFCRVEGGRQPGVDLVAGRSSIERFAIVPHSDTVGEHCFALQKTKRVPTCVFLKQSIGWEAWKG